MADVTLEIPREAFRIRTNPEQPFRLWICRETNGVQCTIDWGDDQQGRCMLSELPPAAQAAYRTLAAAVHAAAAAKIGAKEVP